MKLQPIVAGLALGGLLAAGALHAPASEAAPTVVATCTGMRGLAKVTPGLGNTNGPVTVSTKNVTNINGTVGACSYSHPGVGSGTKQMASWSSKTSSPVADCIKDTDDAEYPTSGKSTTVFTDGTKTEAYVTIVGTKAGTQLVQVLQGIVTKGNAAGGFVSQEIWTIPVVKDKTQTADWTPPAPGTPGPVLGPHYPGYAFDIIGAPGCQDPTGATAANITGLLVGTGQSQIYPDESANGTTITFGV